MNYSRENPSSNYVKNIDFYKNMHENGFYTTSGEKKSIDEAYAGRTTSSYVKLIKNIIIKNQCESLLDYGCGKAKLYNEEFQTNKASYPNLRDYWNIKINLYDPCYKPYDKLPTEKVDISICIDVLEHIPMEDIDWVLREFMSLTKKITFFNIACYPAIALLPNGENAHINIQTPEWWQEKMIKCAEEFKHLKILALCGYTSEKGNLKWKSVDIRDSVQEYIKKNK